MVELYRLRPKQTRPEWPAFRKWHLDEKPPCRIYVALCRLRSKYGVVGDYSREVSLTARSGTIKRRNPIWSDPAQEDRGRSRILSAGSLRIGSFEGSRP